jgi:hypothetical protein
VSPRGGITFSAPISSKKDARLFRSLLYSAAAAFLVCFYFSVLIMRGVFGACCRTKTLEVFRWD